MDLKDKIERLIIELGLTSTRFADYIGVNRPIISHILSGRNKPSLEIIQKIVGSFPELGYNWISDEESLDLEIIKQIAINKDFNDLFFNNHSARESNETNNLHNHEGIFNSQGLKNNNNSNEKRISKIVVFYSDNTFSQFDPS